jgi:hypothetical protein
MFFLSQQLAAGGFETRVSQQTQDTGYEGSPTAPSVKLPHNVRTMEFLSNNFVLHLKTSNGKKVYKKNICIFCTIAN